jgi:3-oxoacyl-[acyl-carrier-protein] synthase III
MSYRILDRTLHVLGSGQSLPGAPVTNDQLATVVSKLHGGSLARSFRAIAARLGIVERHLCRDFVEPVCGPRNGDTNPDLCARALGEALQEARLRGNDLGYLIGHTATPHTLLPPNVAWIADRIGYDGPFGELRQACTGFANALFLVAGLLTEQDSQPIAVVGSETGSVFFDPRTVHRDRDQLVNMSQMGDGAGAILLGPDDGRVMPTITKIFYGTLAHGHKPGLVMSQGGSGHPAVEASVNTFEHDFTSIKELGPALFRAGLRVAEEAGISLESVDWVVPHQANGRLAEVFQSAFGIPSGKVVVIADHTGNLGSAAIWVALHRLRRSGQLFPGARVLILGAESTKYLYGGFLYTH